MTELPGLVGRHLLSMRDLGRADIEALCSLSERAQLRLKSRTNRPPLDGILASLFFEPSTRTRFSFESAALRLGASIIGFGTPGETRAGAPDAPETLADTARVFSGFADVAVIRHGDVNAVDRYARHSTIPVINGGNGIGPGSEHPTQALVDLYTIRRHHRAIDGLAILLIGGMQLRVAHSLAFALLHYDVKLYILCADEHWWTAQDDALFRSLGLSYERIAHMSEVIREVDVVYHLGFDEEAIGSIPARFHIGVADVALAKSSLMIMHSLPRETEIDAAVDDLACAQYFVQAHNGVPVRMAILSAILGWDI
jgi:aspartate carbamoyltransferase catalytic subunit